MTCVELPRTPRISAFCNGTPPGVVWVEEEEGTAAIKMGSVSLVATQILPCYPSQEGTANVEPAALEDAIGRISHTRI